MNLSFLGRLAALTCSAALVLTVSCSNPASTTTNTGGTGGKTDTSKLGFESGFDVTTVTADDNNVKAGTSMGMAFKLDTALANTGASSLNCTGTSQMNRYSTDYFGEAKVPLAATTDFTGKTVAVAVSVPTGSAVSAINVTLLDSTGRQTLLAQQNTIPGSWTTLSFPVLLDSAHLSYQDSGADITKTVALRFRFETGTTSVPVNVNLDSVNW